MLVPVIQIGNSRGIRIPKTILQQLDVEESLELKLSNKEIVLRPVRKGIRKNWKEVFQKMHERNEDSLFIDDIDAIDDGENFQWEW